MQCVSLYRRRVVSSVVQKVAIPLVTNMFSTKTSYEEAVCKLNLLQSNKATIDQIRRDIKTGQRCTNIEDMECYLSRTGVTLDKLDELSVIHIAGTKGKGSTSAMCESILRHHGFKTGFYSSPHLVAVRERIRLNGRVISEEVFAQHFHHVHSLLDSSKAFEGDMPKYFSFLTVMAFNLFLKEKVDVAIIEVGIGGVVDYTNVLRKVPVVGITALGLDHTFILGHTLPQIAAAKAGIMKPGCEAYTVAQPQEALDVLKQVARKNKCPLTVVPDYKSYTFPNVHNTDLPVDLEAYQTNASLAIQLSHAWMRLTKPLRKNGLKKYEHNDQNHLTNGNSIEDHIVQDSTVENGLNISKNKVENELAVEERLVHCVTKETMAGLTSCKWPGRYQVLKTDYAQFYLDGAHTKESMDICSQWFKNNAGPQDKTLIFSATGDRDGETLLQPLRDINFATVYFVIPTAHKNVTQNHDNYSKIEDEELLARCEKHAKIWQEFNKGCVTNVIVAACVADALAKIKKNSVNSPTVLVTGSLHLVGAALSILDPNLSS